MDAIEDQLGNVRTEWKLFKEKWFAGEVLDPVFEGMVNDFCVFDVTMQEMYKKTELFMKSVDQLAEGLVTLSESAIQGLTQVDDQLIKSDSCKMREATNQITRGDAPHSAIAKLRRDMDFNIMHPIRNHLVNNRNLKSHFEKRRRKFMEYTIQKKTHDDYVKRGFRNTDRRLLQAQSSLESAKMAFHEADKYIFEWLYILEEYKGDILDSTLQTLKYLQYEFFATSAHAISTVLPARMEFRPMVEMTPDHLEAQVEMEMQEADDHEEADDGTVPDFSLRLIEKLAKDNKTKPGEGVDSAVDQGASVPVDPLSLSSLLSQGFEEGPARQALRKHRNDTQAALDWLVNGGVEEEPADSVRMPTTVKRVQRLKARRRAQQEKNRRQEESRRGEDREATSGNRRSTEEPPHDRGQGSSTPARNEAAPPAEKPKPTPPSAPQDLLGFDQGPQQPQQQWQPPQKTDDLLSLDAEPPPPTDFSKAGTDVPLPPMQSLDLTRCEKAPLPASVAAGTAMARAGTSEGLTPEQLSAAQALAAQAQITPEQLLVAAQQLQAQQQGQRQAVPSPQELSGGSPLAPGQLASLYQAQAASSLQPQTAAGLPGTSGGGGYAGTTPAMGQELQFQRQENGGGGRTETSSSSFQSLDPLAMSR